MGYSSDRRFRKNSGIFATISLRASLQLIIIGGIGVIIPRLHGFHRFLPHLWELFYCAGELSYAVVKADVTGGSGTPAFKPRLAKATLLALATVAGTGAIGRTIGTTPIFA